jgi:exodeoxyribonuclease VIII
MSVHVMLDLETMGTSRDAAIVAIGAVRFDPVELFVDQRGMFYRTISLVDACRHGGVIDPRTVLWWLQQSADARREVEHGAGHISHALSDFTAWLSDSCAGNTEAVRVWGNAASFDCTILGSAFARCDLPQPWSYWQERCYRTMRYAVAGNRVLPTKADRALVHHRADHDALSQAYALVALATAFPGWDWN